MYGKIFESLYEGSMVGAGAINFAVWGYVIAKQKPDSQLGSVVSLNPVMIAASIGEDVRDIEKSIEYLCSTDAKSTSPESGGRRLIKKGTFLYQVVNGKKYREIRNEMDRATQLREAQRRFRAKKLLEGKPLPGEANFEAAEARGASEREKNGIVTNNLPRGVSMNDMCPGPEPSEHADPPEDSMLGANGSLGEPEVFEQLDHPVVGEGI